MTDPPREAHVAAQVMTDLTSAELVPLLRREGLDARLSQATYKRTWVFLEGEGDMDFMLQPEGPGAYLLRDGFGERPALESLARNLSAALVRLGIRHRMEFYDGSEMFDYLHHDWPLE